jgi:hypothetical protein
MYKMKDFSSSFPSEREERGVLSFHKERALQKFAGIFGGHLMIGSVRPELIGITRRRAHERRETSTSFA